MATRNRQQLQLRQHNQRRQANAAIDTTAPVEAPSRRPHDFNGGDDNEEDDSCTNDGIGASGSSGSNTSKDNAAEGDDYGDDCGDDDDDDVSSSLADTVAWHQDDLTVAAELGKALLERNRRLKCRLRRARAACQESGREAAQLASRLADMRRLEDSRARACDEVERQCAELESRNDQLRLEQRRCRLRIEALTAAEAAAEARADDLRRQLAAANAALRLASVASTTASTATVTATATMSTVSTSCRWERLGRRGSWPPSSATTLAVPSTLEAPTETPTPSCRQSRGTAGHGGVVGGGAGAGGRSAAPSEPPPVQRRRLGEPDAAGRAERTLLASGQHQPAYRLLFAEARARLRQLMEQQQHPPEADEAGSEEV